MVGNKSRIIQTVLDKYDCSNSKKYTFCTSGGSGIESSISDFANYVFKLEYYLQAKDSIILQKKMLKPGWKV